MTEKNFLNFILIEGIILMLSALCILILPKIGIVSIGIIICLTFIAYGAYKMAKAILTRKYTDYFLLDANIGFVLFVTGVFLFFSTDINFVIFNILIGLFFLLESISSKIFAFKIKNKLYYWGINLVLSCLQFIMGLIIILCIPGIAFWSVGILCGIIFLISGMSRIGLYVANKYAYEI